jgi:N utilization substance protein A
VVSRSHPDLVRRLLELEVPELADGTVEIVAIAREPGHRTKIAVLSHDPNVDAKGAAVGARGSRVRQVVNELRGEKVDVVQWRENTAEFIAEALGPARVKEVQIDEENKTATVLVGEHQLSLAIGKEGQNARLAARLSGYKVDIRSDREGEEPVEVIIAESEGTGSDATMGGTEPALEAVEAVAAAEPATEELAAGGTVPEEAATEEPAGEEPAAGEPVAGADSAGDTAEEVAGDDEEATAGEEE